jgi:murein DD-endopeptidase MepM/ murein hydrolase activator NlpD
MGGAVRASGRPGSKAQPPEADAICMSTDTRSGGLRRAAPVILAILALVAVPAASAPAKKGKGGGYGTRVMRLGTAGKDVAALQKYLTKLGIPTSRDGAFGPETRRNVKALEARQKWPVNGRVERKQAKRIQGLAKRRQPVVKGPRSRYYFYGGVVPSVTIAGDGPGTARVDVVDAVGTITASLYVALANDGAAWTGTATWNGLNSSNVVAADGTYAFAMGDAGTPNATITGGSTTAFDYRAHIFPIRKATFSYGGAGSRFGAPRSGHSHQGQDLSARCGARLVAIQGGRVVTRSYQAGGAGNYVVIDGADGAYDSVYMHMKGPGPLTAGQYVKTGQPVGKVGNTGSSSGCHLHFELWSAPGWYQGGRPIDPLAHLQYWDTYS